MDNLNSRERIQKAFPSLLKTVRIEKITIAGIIDEAGVSRTTVYRYYYDQKEILTKS
ncbi:MAG: TetR/AcrR family transcriptional regulator [Lachnospiraceae bacterium]|nr:TetR/AcrR family transcriptional regulator [Lachnospiraceae bacterium]